MSELQTARDRILDYLDSVGDNGVFIETIWIEFNQEISRETIRKYLNRLMSINKVRSEVASDTKNSSVYKSSHRKKYYKVNEKDV